MVALQQFVGTQQQLGEVDDAFALALLVIEIVQLGHAPLHMVVCLDLVRALAAVLGVVDEVHQVLGRVLLVVHVQRLEHALDHRQLILRIEDLERLRQRGVAVVRAQQAVAQAVEGADPHAARVHRQHRRQAREHLLGGLVGEGHGHDAGRGHLPGLDQPGDAGRQHPRLAGPGARENKGALGRQRDGRQLFGVQIVEEIHAGIITS